MASIRGVLQQSLKSTSSPEHESKRRDDLLSVSNPVIRSGLLALHLSAVRNPALTAAMFDLDYNPDFDRLGKGTQSTVFKVSRTEVVKVVDRSIGLSSADKRRKATLMQKMHDTFKNRSSAIVLPHRVIVGPHPLNAQKEAVLIRQNYCPLHDIGIFTMNDPAINIKNLEAALTEFPLFLRGLSTLVESGLPLIREEGLAPDTNGIGNFGLDLGGRLLFRDSQPLSPDNKKGFPIAAEQLGNLAFALR